MKRQAKYEKFEKKQNYKDRNGQKQNSLNRNNFKSKQRQQHKAQSNGNTGVQHMPTIEQMLAIPQDDRLTKSSVIFEQVKPFLASFMQKKQGSRVTQLLFKWGSHATKTIIYKQVIKSWKQLIKSKYALYTIAKVAKQFQLPGLVDDLSSLQNNREGAQILQNFIQANPESQTSKKLKQKITSMQLAAIQSNDLKAQQVLDNMAIRSVQKQFYWFQLSKLILRLRLPYMFEEQKQKAIQLLVANVATIVNDQQGVRLFIELVNNCSSKQKKTLIKAYKGNLDQIVKANNVSYVSVIKLITDTDDTVLIIKSFEQQFSLLIPQILQCKKAFSLIFSLFCPRNNNYNILGKYEPHVLKTSCKKPQEQRKKQLRECVYGFLIEFLKNQQNLTKILKNPVESRLIIGIEKSMKQDANPQHQNFVTLILNYFLNNAKQSLKNNTFNESILSDGNGSKILKSLIYIQEGFIDFYCQQFAKLFIKNIKSVIQSRGSFVLLAILEKGGRDHLIKQIVKTGVKFDKCIAGTHFMKLINNTSTTLEAPSNKTQKKNKK